MTESAQDCTQDEIERLRQALEAETERRIQVQGKVDRARAEFEEFVSMAAHWAHRYGSVSGGVGGRPFDFHGCFQPGRSLILAVLCARLLPLAVVIFRRLSLPAPTFATLVFLFHRECR